MVVVASVWEQVGASRLRIMSVWDTLWTKTSKYRDEDEDDDEALDISLTTVDSFSLMSGSIVMEALLDFVVVFGSEADDL